MIVTVMVMLTMVRPMVVMMVMVVVAMIMIVLTRCRTLGKSFILTGLQFLHV